MRVLVIRHHDVDTAGFIAEAFEARGASLDVHLFPDDGPLPGFGGVDHIVVMGAVSSVNDPRSLDRRGTGLAPRGRPGGRARARHLLRRPGDLRRARRPGRGHGRQRDRLVHRGLGRRGRGPGRALAGIPRGPLPAARRRHGAGPQRGGRAGLPDRPALRRPVPPRGRRSPAQALAGLDGRRGRRAASAPTPTSSWPTPSARSPPRGPGRTGWSPPRWPSGTASALSIPGDDWGASLDNPRQPTTAAHRPFRWVDVPLVML